MTWLVPVSCLVAIVIYAWLTPRPKKDNRYAFLLVWNDQRQAWDRGRLRDGVYYDSEGTAGQRFAVLMEDVPYELVPFSYSGRIQQQKVKFQ